MGHVPAIMLIVTVLLGCAEESSEDRRFANEPAPTEDQPTSTVPATAGDVSGVPTVAVASPESLLSTRGAPNLIYVRVGDALWTLGEGEPRELRMPAGASVLAFDASPSGDSVAVAVTMDGSGVSLLVVEANGLVRRTIRDVIPSIDRNAATPPVSPTSSPAAVVDWGLQGDTILVGVPDGRLATVPVEGEPQPLAVDIENGVLLDARLSPRGDSIAVLRRDERGMGALLVVSLTGDAGTAARQVAPTSEDGRQTVLDMGWLPDGGSLLYVEADAGADGSQPHVEGDLFRVQLAGMERTLVATGGKAGPVGTVLDFAPSPDGKSVAYVIGIPEGDAWAVHSVWLTSLRGPTEYQVPTGSETDVPGLWWTTEGIVWATRSPLNEDTFEFVFYRIQHDAEPVETLRVSEAPSSATPVGGTPVVDVPATPAASATPDRE
ncbi:MAG: hypothetical protein H0W06_03455 [Chloroflexia bacterium]|nr:hypothetical protein [Chloroflexia bacterium]